MRDIAPYKGGMMGWRLVLVLALLGVGAARGAPVEVVAAENFYGDVARQVGGADVRVTSILSNPDQDPHLFEVSPSIARAVSGARIVVYNGLGYDPWMEGLLRTAGAGERTVIAVGALAGRKMGDNPHVWYDPQTMLAYAVALEGALEAADPGHAAGFRERLGVFRGAIGVVEGRIASLRARLAGVEATATEPVFGYMFAALGMGSRNMGFQLAVMNGAEPSVSDVRGFEEDLRMRRVRLLVYNSQASSPVADRMRALAAASRVPVVGATETAPPGMRYQGWMMDELDAIDRALPP